MNNVKFFTAVFFCALFSLYYAACDIAPAGEVSQDANFKTEEDAQILPDYCVQIDSTAGEGGEAILRFKAGAEIDSVFSAQINISWKNGAQVEGFWANDKIQNGDNPNPYKVEAQKFSYSYFPQNPKQGTEWKTEKFAKGEQFIQIQFDKHPGKIAIPINPNGKAEFTFGILQGGPLFTIQEAPHDLCPN